MTRIYKNWPVHNIIAHPAMQVLNWLQLRALAQIVHDKTLPIEDMQL